MTNLKPLDEGASISDIADQYVIRNTEYLWSKTKREKVKLEAEMLRLLNLLKPQRMKTNV